MEHVTASRAAPARLPPEGEMQRAVRERDPSYEGVFVLGVRTTGVYCRPGCPARTPRPENVRFFADGVAAEAAGFRPCLRCRPERAADEGPAWMEQLLAELQRPGAPRLADADLRARGLDPVLVRRAFRRRFGSTFHAWQRARRLGLAHAELRAGAGVEAARRGAGFASQSGFRDAFARLFGAPPAGGLDEVPCVGTRLTSVLGPLLVVASERGVCMLEFCDRRGVPGQARSLAKWLGARVVPGENEHTRELAAELDEYFRGRRTRFEVPLDLAGPPFHLEVWRRLTQIPCGETRSYGELAAELGRPTAQRAVARANGANRVSILVPCHRVIGADGRLVGYGGGLWRKRRLLELEGAAAGA